jgi:hypothetical protein
MLASRSLVAQPYYKKSQDEHLQQEQIYEARVLFNVILICSSMSQYLHGMKFIKAFLR